MGHCLVMDLFLLKQSPSVLFFGDCFVMGMGIVNDWIAFERIILIGGTIDL